VCVRVAVRGCEGSVRVAGRCVGCVGVCGGGARVGKVAVGGDMRCGGMCEGGGEGGGVGEGMYEAGRVGGCEGVRARLTA